MAYNYFVVYLKMLITKERKNEIMKVIVLASQKGGAGKTTLSAHLAVASVLSGAEKTLIMDMDEQGSLTSWWNAREAEQPYMTQASLSQLPEKIKELEKAGFEMLFIDTPPKVTNEIRQAVSVADLVVIPVRPSPHDLRAVGATVDIVKESKKAFIFALTQAKMNANLTAQAIAALSEFGVVAPSIIVDRVDFASSMIDGRTVLESDPKGKSADEIIQLFNFVKSRFNEKNKTRKKEIV